MFKITLPADRAEPDMAAVASAFGISIEDVEDDIHIGTISRWFEAEEGDEDNKTHQIFASEKHGIWVDVDEHGTVKSVSDYENAVVPTGGTNRGDAGGGKDTGAFEPNTLKNPATIREARLDALLDEALDESFPASDSIAISFGSPQRTARSSSKPDEK